MDSDGDENNLARLRVDQCTHGLAVMVGGFPGVVWRRAKRRRKSRWGTTGILPLVELLVFLLREAEDTSQGGLGRSSQQPSSMKLLSLLGQRWFADSHLTQPQHWHQHNFICVFLMQIVSKLLV